MLSDEQLMRDALRLARRARGETSPNPRVGAVLAKRGNIIGRGWHRRAGFPHAEVEVIGIDHAKRRVQLDCRCMVNGKKVLIGEATVLAPSGKFD